MEGHKETSGEKVRTLFTRGILLGLRHVVIHD